MLTKEYKPVSCCEEYAWFFLSIIFLNFGIAFVHGLQIICSYRLYLAAREGVYWCRVVDFNVPWSYLLISWFWYSLSAFILELMYFISSELPSDVQHFSLPPPPGSVLAPHLQKITWTWLNLTLDPHFPIDNVDERWTSLSCFTIFYEASQTFAQVWT